MAKTQTHRDFAGALRSGKPAIIAEIKKASPSKGILTADFHPPTTARQYEAGGASAISVLTDRDYFHGSLKDMQAARSAVALPVIRKDFTTAEYHVVEAAAHGADAILLIAAILDESQLRGFRELAAEYGMASLVEVHDDAELDLALKSGGGNPGSQQPRPAYFRGPPGNIPPPGRPHPQLSNQSKRERHSRCA